jgi:hypothetical protein
MKHIVIGLTALFAAASVLAQGTVNFATRVSGQVDAPVRYTALDGTTGLAGNNYWGQLLAGPAGGTLAPIGQPVEFRNDAGIGYITAGGAVAIPGVAGGSAADVRLVAWDKTLGNDAMAAMQAAGGWGQSAVVNIAATGNPGAIPPTTAANLTGLQGFTMTAVPEPSIAALGLLGAGLLLIRRKK